MTSDAPKVFISYSHDSPEHGDRVLALADRLRADGIDANVDEYVDNPSKGWHLWMEDEIEAADFVLVIATETYDRRRRGREEQSKGHGVRWEGAIISQALYDNALHNVRFVPVVFAAADAAHIPFFLKSVKWYEVGNDDGYEALYRRLTGQPEVVKRPLGKLRKLPPRKPVDPASSTELDYSSASVRELSEAHRRKAELEAIESSTPVAEERERTNEKDGSVLVFVPSGEYLLGTDDYGGWPFEFRHAKPAHRVTLSAFWIGKCAVTNGQYKRYLAANPKQGKPKYWSNSRFNDPRQPVVGVSWMEALAYCQWAGLDLQSEAQWEAAARGADFRSYPWGSDDLGTRRLNVVDDWETGMPAPVGTYLAGAGPFGTLDQVGMVWEWCRDEYKNDAYQYREGKVDPIILGDEKNGSVLRAVRGGRLSSLAPVVHVFLRATTSERPYLPAACRHKFEARRRSMYLGFRVACRFDSPRG